MPEAQIHVCWSTAAYGCGHHLLGLVPLQQGQWKQVCAHAIASLQGLSAQIFLRGLDHDTDVLSCWTMEIHSRVSSVDAAMEGVK